MLGRAECGPRSAERLHDHGRSPLAGSWTEPAKPSWPSSSTSFSQRTGFPISSCLEQRFVAHLNDVPLVTVDIPGADSYDALFAARELAA